MKKLIVVDVQNDFIFGSLGTKEAQEVLPNIVEMVKNWEGEVEFTRDTHDANYLDTQEGKFLPIEHCIEGTSGWQLVPELEEFRQEHNSKTFDKPFFGSLECARETKYEFIEGKIDSVTLIGVCTDICVISNALLIKSASPELPVHVVESCCAGVSPQKHDSAIETMKSCQIIVE
ncbi:MAG: cysteine hydrolase [Clostridia bacterium]|nr:cysteine hydrolase [Clostridia bacterium]